MYISGVGQGWFIWRISSNSITHRMDLWVCIASVSIIACFPSHYVYHNKMHPHRKFFISIAALSFVLLLCSLLASSVCVVLIRFVDSATNVVFMSVYRTVLLGFEGHR